MTEQALQLVQGRVYREGDELVIRMPIARAHELRVSLSPCPCRATKSTASADIRAALSQAIGRATK
jgi:hypothetical protein